MKFTVVFALLVLGCGCPPANEPKLPPYCTNEKAFTDKLLACVDAAPARVDSRACRTKVHRDCGIDMTISLMSRAP